MYPGIKDLPINIHQNFHSEFIHFIIKQVTNSQSPWVNPDVRSVEIPLLRVTAVCARVGEVKGWVAGCAVTKGGKERE